jgi:hypothetical protein
MLYFRLSFIVLLFSGLIVGCGLTEGVVQKDPASYLWFTGNTENAVVYINDLKPISLKKKYRTADEDDEANIKTTHYKIAPGKYTIVVKKADQLVVNRTVLLGNGITREINIP